MWFFADSAQRICHFALGLRLSHFDEWHPVGARRLVFSDFHVEGSSTSQGRRPAS